jgi:glycosyltransferase involved in cell wall biosynthesis
MQPGQKEPISKQGVSIITCTNRRSFLNNLLQNYSRQRHPKKELIIVVNNDRIPLAPYQAWARKLRNVSVFRVPAKYSLGSCLNYAVSKTRYGYIAKFDDDDYYAPYYVTECLLAFRRTNADIIGKRAHYMYLRGSKTLILRFPHDENRPVTRLPGATLVMKRSVANKVRFPDRNVGEDDLFCYRSKRKGYKIYSAGKHNFLAIRRKNSANHTWIISDKELIAYHRVVPHVKKCKRFVQRKPKGAR